MSRSPALDGALAGAIGGTGGVVLLVASRATTVPVQLGGQLEWLTDLAALVRDLALREHEQISLERPVRWWHA